MGRPLRQFAYNQPIEVATRYTRSVYMPAEKIYLLEQLLIELKQKFSVKVLNYYFDEKQIRLELFFTGKSRAALSAVMRWFLTCAAKRINKALGTRGKVFHDRFWSKIIKKVKYVFVAFKRIIKEILFNLGKNISDWPFTSIHKNCNLISYITRWEDVPPD